MPRDLPRRIGWITAVVRVLCLLSGLALIGSRAISVLYNADPQLGPIGALMFLVWAGLTALLFLTVLVWMQAAVTNAQAIAPDARRIRPWMAVLWWFIPPFTFFQPARAMSQTWITSVDQTDNINGPAAAPVAGWWVLASVAAILSAMGAGAVSVDAFGNPIGLIVPGVLWIGALACLSACVKTIARGQRVAAPPADPAPSAAQPA